MLVVSASRNFSCVSIISARKRTTFKDNKHPAKSRYDCEEPAISNTNQNCAAEIKGLLTPKGGLIHPVSYPECVVWHKNTKLFTTKRDAERNSRAIRDRVRDPCHRVIAQPPFPVDVTPVRARVRNDCRSSRRVKARTVCFRFSSIFLSYENVIEYERSSSDRGRLNREEWRRTEPTSTMNRAGRTSATK